MVTSREHIERTIDKLWVARNAGDAKGTVAGFADEGVFRMNAKGTGVAAMSKSIVGKSTVEQVVSQMMQVWQFEDWRKMDLVIDGERAVLHWRAMANCLASGKCDEFDVYDFIKFKDGKIVEYVQSTDTALMMKVAS